MKLNFQFTNHPVLRQFSKLPTLLPPKVLPTKNVIRHIDNTKQNLKTIYL